MSNNLSSILTQDEIAEYGHLIMSVDTDIQLESVILSKRNAERVDEFLTEMKFAKKLADHKLHPMNRLLFNGESGCGKTMLAKALSNTLGYYMLYVDIAKALTDGSVAINISKVFELAEKYKHCIIFFDECDSIAWNRDNAKGDGNARKATNAVFQGLDQMSVDNIFIAATNMLHQIDAAFKTRFNFIMRFDKPELTIEDTMRKFVYPEFAIISDVTPDVRELVEKRNTLSYRELRAIADRQMKKAVINDSFRISMQDTYRVVAAQQDIVLHF